MSPSYYHRKPPATDETPPENAAPAEASAPAASPATPAPTQTQPRPADPPTSKAQPTGQGPATGSGPTADPRRSLSGRLRGEPPREHAPPSPTASPPPAPPTTRAWHWLALGAIVALALALRLRDPLSTPILGAEDPYLHMERTWNLLQGRPIPDYPPGLMILLFPFAALGPDAFHAVARFLPPVLGAAAVAATFFVCRPYVHPVGALAGALALATMSEHIFRTNMLMPTAIDLLLVPILLLAVLRLREGRRWGAYAAAAFGVYFALVHPWALPLVAVPIGVFWVVQMVLRREERRWAVPAAAGGLAALAGVVAVLPVFSPFQLVADRALPRLVTLAGDPASLLPLPQYVDLPHMLGWPALLAGGFGAIWAARDRSRFALLALLWCALLLPLILVDWFQIWYIPHRTVAYFAVGLALLVAVGVAGLVQVFEQARPRARRAVPALVLTVLLVFSLPGALATQSWYRVYTDDHIEAFEDLEARGLPFVMAGGWELRAGYRALTGGPALYNPGFFHDAVVREYELRQHPDLVVLVDDRTSAHGLPTAFLASSEWEQLDRWGEVRAYVRR